MRDFISGCTEGNLKMLGERIPRNDPT